MDRGCLIMSREGMSEGGQGARRMSAYGEHWQMEGGCMQTRCRRNVLELRHVHRNSIVDQG